MPIRTATLPLPASDRTVLIVDDDTIFARAVARGLSDRSLLACTASTFEEATAIAADTRPDIAIVDVYLGDRSGLELLSMLKRDNPGLCGVVVSGSSDPDLASDAARSGATAFLAKPVTVKAIVDELERNHSASDPPPSPLEPHLLTVEALHSDGVDRFFALSSDLLCVAAADGNFRFLNSAWETTLGFTTDELCATPWHEFVHPDDREATRAAIASITPGRTLKQFRNRYRCKDGTYKWLWWHAAASPDGELLYGSARDITTVVRAEEALRDEDRRLRELADTNAALVAALTAKNNALAELDRCKSETTALLVHDLKNPMTVILTNLDYIADELSATSAFCVEALHDARSAGRRALRLVANLLDLSRHESGCLALDRKPTDLEALVAQLVAEHRIEAEARQIHLALPIARGRLVGVDEGMLTRVFENVFDNAFRYTPNRGEIHVDVQHGNHEVVVRIGNTGPAIPPELREAIFDKYRIGDVKGRNMHWGLGLYFCRTAVEAHGGTITVEETPPLSTVFVVRIPV